jgi:Zn-finger nucleic acid-binding protein
MRCPCCEPSLLEQRETSGFVFARCPSCRGIWLGRAELEALVSQAVTELQGIGSREAEPRAARERRWYAILTEALE